MKVICENMNVNYENENYKNKFVQNLNMVKIRFSPTKYRALILCVKLFIIAFYYSIKLPSKNLCFLFPLLCINVTSFYSYSHSHSKVNVPRICIYQHT